MSSTALEILSTATPAREAPNHPDLRKIWPTPDAAHGAAKRRDKNGLAEFDAVLLINDKLFFIPERVARWALEYRKPGKAA